MIRLLLALAAAMLVAAPSFAQEANWSQTRAVTDASGYAMGNPQAPVHLVEYVSITCPHCAHFMAEAMGPLVADYVDTGKVYFEIRNFIRDPADLAGAMMARCSGTDGFFSMTDTLLANQQSWLGALQAKPADELNMLLQTEGLEGIVTVSGMAALAEAEGLDPTTRAQCLSGQPHVDQLINMTQVARQEHEVRGTPSFLVNDVLVSAHDWASLQPLLDAALAQ